MLGKILGSVAGAAVGGLLGGKGQSSTQQTRPYLPEDYEKGYTNLLSDATSTYEQPFTPAERTRVAPPTSAFDALFANPEMMELQRRSDRNYFTKPQQPQTPSKQMNQQDISSLRNEMLARQFVNSGNPTVSWGFKDASPEVLAELGGLLSQNPNIMKLPPTWYAMAGGREVMDLMDRSRTGGAAPTARQQPSWVPQPSGLMGML